MSTAWSSPELTITVTLKPLIGQQTVRGIGEVDVHHDLYMVFAGSRQIEMDCGKSPRHVGYAKPTGNTVEYLVEQSEWPRDAIEYITAQVGKLTNTQRRSVVPMRQNPTPQIVELSDGDELD